MSLWGREEISVTNLAQSFLPMARSEERSIALAMWVMSDTASAKKNKLNVTVISAPLYPIYAGEMATKYLFAQVFSVGLESLLLVQLLGISQRQDEKMGIQHRLPL